MRAIIQFSYPANCSDLRVQLLESVAPLLLRGEAELQFIAKEDCLGGSATETISLGFQAMESALAVMQQCRLQMVIIRLLQVEPVSLGALDTLMFP